MTSIPLLDLAQQYRTVQPEIEAAVRDVMASGRYIGGDRVSEFEAQFAAYVGTAHCIACNSGTDALFLAMRALDIGAGDRVITTPFTFIATVETISAVGATPVLVDIDPQTFNLDVSQVAAAIDDRTKAIVPVHLFGRPLEGSALLDLARQHDLPILEDCAQATGATWNGRRVGSVGRVGGFSFFPTKNLGAFGDGGAVTTDDPEIARRIRAIKEHGATQRYYHEEIGINSRLDALQAAILGVKLNYLDRWNQQRREVARRYGELLDPLPDLQLPQDTPGHVWNQYTLRVLPPRDRDRLKSRLQDLGVGTMVYYPKAIHQQPVYADLGAGSRAFPEAERACREVLSLPMFPELTAEQQQAVVYRFKEALGD